MIWMNTVNPPLLEASRRPLHPEVVNFRRYARTSAMSSVTGASSLPERAHHLAEDLGMPVHVGARGLRAHQGHVVEGGHEDAPVAQRQVQVGVELVVGSRGRLLAGPWRRPREPV